MPGFSEKGAGCRHELAEIPLQAVKSLLSEVAVEAEGSSYAKVSHIEATQSTTGLVFSTGRQNCRYACSMKTFVNPANRDQRKIRFPLEHPLAAAGRRRLCNRVKFDHDIVCERRDAVVISALSISSWPVNYCHQHQVKAKMAEVSIKTFTFCNPHRYRRE